MAAPPPGSHISSVQLATARKPFRRPVGGLTANNVAFGAINAKADVLQTWDDVNDRFDANGPSNDAANGRFVFTPEDGNAHELLFYGEGANNATGSGRVWVWNTLYDPAFPRLLQWHPTLLIPSFTITLSQKTGVAGGLVTDLQRYADTITLSTERGLTPLNTRVLGPAAADDGSVRLGPNDDFGASLIEVELTISGGSATKLGFWARRIPN